jgi:hypothetical protein
VSRRLRLLLAGAAVLVLAAPAAEAKVKLTIPAARDKAAAFAANTCAHDKACARSGVRGCRRQSDHIVLCRIFDHRKTDEQGNFVCTRLVRVALKPPSHRVAVTGVSNWSC